MFVNDISAIIIYLSSPDPTISVCLLFDQTLEWSKIILFDGDQKTLIIFFSKQRVVTYGDSTHW